MSCLTRGILLVASFLMGASLVHGVEVNEPLLKAEQKAPAPGPKSDEEPCFRFVQVTDLHVQPHPPRKDSYRDASEKTRWIVETINRETFTPPPAFVVGTGDLADGERLDWTDGDLKELQSILKPLKCPFYPVVGNHEVCQQERSPQYLRPYLQAFGQDRAEYTFVHGGILFVALNNSGAPDAKAARQRNEWLRGVLTAAKDRPKILLCHIPLIPLREEATLAASFGFTSYCDRDPGTLQLVEEYKDTVIAVLCGHLHLTGMRQRQGIYHVSISGTASYPCDFAIYDVFPDRIVVSVQQLPGQLARSQPSIHGKTRHGRDFTDAEHRTPEEYQSGRVEERRFTILCSGSKRPQKQVNSR